MKCGRRTWFLKALFWGYLAWLLAITVFRPGFSLQELGQHGVIAMTPFREYYWWLRQGRYGLLLYLFVGNIGIFSPFGGYLAWRRPRWRLWCVSLAGAGLSAGIELGQYLFGTGVTDVADLVLNTLGAFLGAAAVRGVLALRRRKRREQRGAMK